MDANEPPSFLIPVVLVVVFVEQLFLPVIIGFVLMCYRGRKKVAPVDRRREIRARFREELGQFDRRYPVQAPGDCSTQMLSEIVDIERRLVADVENLRAQRQMPETGSKETVSFSRIVSIHSYVSFIIWVVYVAVSFSVHPEQNADLVRILGYVGIALMILHYVIMLIESYSCNEKQYLTNLSPVISAVERIDHIKSVQPAVKLSAECYHYETRSRTVTSTDSEGRTITSEETYDERVVTASINEPFVFRFWQDHSQTALVGIHRKKITKIKMELQILFGDVETAKDFEERYAKFKEENKHRDTYVDFNVSRTVPGFNRRLAAYVDASAKAWWINSLYFWLSTLFWLGWIYRLAFKYSTAKTTYNVIKSIYVNRPVAPSINNCNSAEAEIVKHHDIELRNIVCNGRMETPDYPQHDSSLTSTKYNIEAILRFLETSGDEEDSIPLKLMNDAEFMHVALANRSQLREATIDINS